jgi:hypothetical protein
MSTYREQVKAWEQDLERRSGGEVFIDFHTLMEVPSPEPPPLARKATKEELAALTWETLLAHQPALADFYAQCVQLGTLGGSWSDRVRRWTAEMQEELDFLVGWYADSDDPLLRNSKAYEIAKDRCWVAVTGDGEDW